jgi:uncharacterized caspase-like protein
VLLTALLVACMAATSSSATHVRVLIFASSYEHTRDDRLRLSNTLVDARSVESLFRHSIGATDVRLVADATPEMWRLEIAAFTERLKPGDTAILYYAGHAVQKDGRNYFLSADGSTLALISAEEVLSLVMTSRPHGTIFFIDACRDNPFHDERSVSARGQSLEIHSLSRGFKWTDGTPSENLSISVSALSVSAGGLSQMSNVHGRNAIVFFSTDPGNVAKDGPPGLGSPFANAISRELGKRVSLDDALRAVTQDVSSSTVGEQTPWRQGDIGFSLFLVGETRVEIPPAD